MAAPDKADGALREPEVLVRTLADNDPYPNSDPPVLVYRQALRPSDRASHTRTRGRAAASRSWAPTPTAGPGT
jgi:hypothetical protein